MEEPRIVGEGRERVELRWHTIGERSVGKDEKDSECSDVIGDEGMSV